MSGLLDDYVEQSQMASELHVTVRTLQAWQNLPNGLPSFKIGKRVYYKRPSVRAWLEARERKPNQRRAG